MFVEGPERWGNLDNTKVELNNVKGKKGWLRGDAEYIVFDIILILPSNRFFFARDKLWALLRIFPPPLTALLLLLLIKPSTLLAGLALGLHHSGVMGKVLEDDLKIIGDKQSKAINQLGAGKRISLLYGPLSVVSKRYLNYALVRFDVIIKDTAVVGMVGGAGLGWQLIEALSSFYWAQVLWIVIIFAILTYIGEILSSHVQRRLRCKSLN